MCVCVCLCLYVCECVFVAVLVCERECVCVCVYMFVRERECETESESEKKSVWQRRKSICECVCEREVITLTSEVVYLFPFLWLRPNDVTQISFSRTTFIPTNSSNDYFCNPYIFMAPFSLRFFSKVNLKKVIMSQSYNINSVEKDDIY